MKTMTKTYPSHVLVDACRALPVEPGVSVSLLWEQRGPKDTRIAWHSCYNINGTPVIVQTYKDGNGWDAFTPCQSPLISDAILDVLDRCGVQVPRKAA